MSGQSRATANPALVLCLLLLLPAATVAAQDRSAVRAMKKLHDELCGPERIISVGQAEAALAQLQEWNLSPSELGEQDRGILLRTEFYVAAAIGNAPKAVDMLDELRQLAPDTRETWEAAYVVAMLTGDAKAGKAALKELSKTTGTRQRGAISQRRRWIQRVGVTAPDTEITAENGTRLSIEERDGIVLVIDFWNSRRVTKEYAGALKDLYETYRSEPQVQFLGINTDGKGGADAARQFAREAGYVWPQHYEEKGGRASLAHGTFKAGSPPWTILIDGEGRVRAVGAVTEPTFHYALRTAIADATGKFTKAEDDGGASAKDRTEPAAPRVGKGDLPSNDEAEAMLRQARTYLRTGMKKKAKEILKEIIRKYPGTRQARDAEERLTGMP